MSLWGRSSTMFCAGALAVNLLMVVGLLMLLAVFGFESFWQGEIVRLELQDGTAAIGEVTETESVSLQSQTDGTRTQEERLQLRTGNREFNNQQEFRWVREADVASRSAPENLVMVERDEGGPVFGTLIAVRRGDDVIAASLSDALALLPEIRERQDGPQTEITRLESELRTISRELESLRQERQGMVRRSSADSATDATSTDRFSAMEQRTAELKDLSDDLQRQRVAAESDLAQESLVVQIDQGTEATVPIYRVLRVVQPNSLGFFGKLGLWTKRMSYYLTAEPRDSNRAGGIMPALLGTVLMVFMMTLLVTPLGVLAAIYLREYAKQGPLVRMVRIAVNNLAGVPSIVFGVFGLGFFVIIVGGNLDAWFFADALPRPTFGTGGIMWAALTLAILTVPVVIVATEEGLAAVPRPVREGSLALGATKHETNMRVVVPAALPGILTGVILAIARAAGEVAPLMLVGVVKMAPDLPINGEFPYVHLEQKFMHLGFHIYDLAYQSPDVEASKPLVYATAFVLIILVIAMNLVAITMRNHLRRKYSTSAV